MVLFSSFFGSAVPSLLGMTWNSGMSEEKDLGLKNTYSPLYLRVSFTSIIRSYLSSQHSWLNVVTKNPALLCSKETTSNSEGLLQLLMFFSHLFTVLVSSPDSSLALSVSTNELAVPYANYLEPVGETGLPLGIFSHFIIDVGRLICFTVKQIPLRNISHAINGAARSVLPPRHLFQAQSSLL
jgi:hypothetical protein